MATEAAIRAAERARLEAIVAEFGTEAERAQLLISGWRGGGPDPAFLVVVARRVERRTRLGLPAVKCAGDPPTHACSCLEFALDEAGRGGKRAILRAARGFHWSPPQRALRAVPVPDLAATPREGVAEAQEANGRLVDPSPLPKPTPEPEPPFRIVRRARKWFDPEPQSFRDTRF